MSESGTRPNPARTEREPAPASPLLLGLETSGQETALALVQDDATIASVREPTQARHNEAIFGLLSRLFASIGRKAGELSGIGVSIGPGMFTSLRVGLSVAKGLALSFGIPLKGINTLDGLALTARRQYPELSDRLPLLPLIDARKGEVYCASYLGVERQTDFQVIAPEKLAGLVPGAVAVCGSGVRPYRSTIESAFGPRAQLIELDYPSAEIIAGQTWRLLRRDGPDLLESLTPLYLRRTDAELKRA